MFDLYLYFSCWKDWPIDTSLGLDGEFVSETQQ